VTPRPDRPESTRETPHTPGPWVAELDPEGGFIITNGPAQRDGTWVLASRGPIAHRAEESAANARLIVSAPYLSARLRASEQALEKIAQIRCGIPGHSVAVGCGAASIARAALEEGEREGKDSA
jgi:hypothetical protein